MPFLMVISDKVNFTTSSKISLLIIISKMTQPMAKASGLFTRFELRLLMLATCQVTQVR